MLAEAISKIKAEMEQNNNNSYVQVVGNFLLQHLDGNPQDAEKIMVTEKTIVKSLDDMRKVAEKKRVDNCAVLTDQEGFEIVLGYFGMNGKPAPIVHNAPVPEAPLKHSPGFDVKLEDLLL